MAIVPIVQIPDPVLNKKSKKAKFDDQTKMLIQNLLDTIRNAKNPEGAGLAAPQLGVLKRVCIARSFHIDPKNPDNTIAQEHVLVNPKIISKSNQTDIGWEGCLSIPDTYGQVERAKKIKIKAIDEKGETIRFTATGFLARVIQHEIDHLDGVLFTSKMIGEPMTEEQLDALIATENEEEEPMEEM